VLPLAELFTEQLANDQSGAATGRARTMALRDQDEALVQQQGQQT